MKAALDKAADRYADRPALAAARRKGAVRRRIAARAPNVVLRFRDDGRAHQGARLVIERNCPDLAVARDRRGRRRAPAGGGAQARGAEAHPGWRRRAEHPDPAQPRERARRGRADHPAAGRRPRRRAAARRAGHGARQGHPRPHRDARDPHGQRRARARSRRRSRGSVPFGSDLFTERGGTPAAGAAPGGAHRRPHQRRAARLRPAQQRAGRAREPRRRRARASSRKSRARTSASAWRSCSSKRARPKSSPRR